jgi:hypothetical protein
MKSLANEKNALLDGHFLFQRFRFHLEPNVPLHMPAYNKGNVIRGGFGSAFPRIENSNLLSRIWFTVRAKWMSCAFLF